MLKAPDHWNHADAIAPQALLNLCHSLQVGTILIEQPLATNVLKLESEPYSGKWGVVKVFDGLALDRKIRAAGWNFFFMAAEIKVLLLGALGPKKGSVLTPCC
ncbi:MAG: hypothetical protein WB952_14505 [Terriglobales bacterium]